MGTGTPSLGSSIAPRRTLVMRGGALGDFVLTIPVLTALARPRSGVAGTAERPGTVDLAGVEAHGLLALDAGLVERSLRLDDPRWAPLWAGGDLGAVRDLVAPYDRIVILRPVDAAAVVRRLRRCGVYDVTVHDPRPPTDGSCHATEHLQQALQEHEAGTDVIPALSLSRETMDRARTRLVGLGVDPRRAVALLPGSGGDLKRWPVECFAAVGRDLLGRGLQPVWILGPVERDRGVVAPGEGVVIDDADVVETAGLLASMSCALGNDAGTAHVAAAVGAVVVLFGPTDHRTWAPRGRRVRVLRQTGFGPRCDVCPRPCDGVHPAPCLEALQPAAVCSEVAHLAAVARCGENARGCPTVQP